MNSFSPINPAEIDVVLPQHDGYPDDLAAGDTIDVLKSVCGSVAREFPKDWWIEPKDWADAARDNDKHGTWPMNYLDRFTHQGNSHECTCHSLRALAESCRNAQRGVIFADGPKSNYRYPESSEFGSVWLSPNSIYAEANPRQSGGAGIRQVMEIGVRRGFLPEKTQPRDYGFKHAIQGTAGGTKSLNQSNGPWLPVSQFPPGWQSTAAWFKLQEIIFPDMWEQAVCIVLKGNRGIGVGRNGHAVPWMKWMAGEQAMAYPDSYDTIRYDSLRTVKACARGGFAIATMTTPDDWMKPAGE